MMLRIIIPSTVTVLLFLGTVFVVILPGMEKSLINEKMNSTQELVRVSWDIMSFFHDKAEQGEISREQAQLRASELLRELRYGSKMNDYFWVHDMQSRMLIHPYRQDLEGKDVSSLSDINLIVSASIDVVKHSEEGFIDYVWQRNGDATLIVPKVSYVKLFIPWGWVISTGIYMDDVIKEVENATRKFAIFSVGIILIVLLLSFYITYRSKKEIDRRIQAEIELKNSHERLEIKVKERTNELTIKNEKITSQNIQIKELIHILCHDLTNPVGGAKNLIEIFIEKNNRDFVMFELLELSRNGLIESLNIIEITRQLVALNENKLNVKVVECGLLNLLDASINVIGAMFTKKRISVISNIDSKIMVNVEPTLFVNSVLNNLLTNAAKFSYKESKVIITAEIKDPFVILKVQDFGIGMPEALLEKVFDPTAKTTRIGTEGEKGTGFGMPLVKKLIEAFDGEMTIISTDHKSNHLQHGTTVTLKLR